MSYEIVSAGSVSTNRNTLGVRSDGTLVYAREEYPSDSPIGIVTRVYVSRGSSSTLEFPGEPQFTRSTTCPYFAVARRSTETFAERLMKIRQRRPFAWTCSVYDANTLEEMRGSVIETEGIPKMALSDDGLTFAACDGAKKETRLRVWRLGVSDEYLRRTCKQCEEPGKEAFDEYCKDLISLNPLRKISHLYRTPTSKKGDDWCWNTDISKKVTKHPNTGKKDFGVERVVLPPPSTLRLHREVIVDDITFSDITSVVVNEKGHSKDSTVELKLTDGTTRLV